MRIVLLGAPGAGKGTQAAFISDNLGLAHVASGDLFRQAQNNGSELGALVRSYMERGELVPDAVTIRVILERISAPDCAQGFILDGFPRTLEQADALDEALTERGQAIDVVLHIKVSTEELVRRLSGRWICRNCQTPYHVISSPPKVAGRCDRCGGELYQRPDDSEEAVRNRLRVFSTETAPLIEYYVGQGKLVEINGEQGVKAVAKEVMAALGPSIDGE
ncbi:MAG: adenylate kinase [Chloroflexi bacterium RBG_13_54_9]|nr:MAG: adenylate kinase [Chloroflexi bacterium RBG_13_54_9]